MKIGASRSHKTVFARQTAKISHVLYGMTARDYLDGPTAKALELIKKTPQFRPRQLVAARMGKGGHTTCANDPVDGILKRRPPTTALAGAPRSDVGLKNA